MITDDKKQHYLPVKRLSSLLRGVASNHNGDFYCSICFHLYKTENKLKKHVCNNHDCCYVEIPDEFNEMLKYNHGEQSLKALAIIYAD